MAQTYLPYWIEPDGTGAPAKVWVKVPSIPADGKVKLYVLINPNQTESLSNPEQVFDFFDDFNNLSRWRIVRVGGSGYIKAEDSYLKLYSTNTYTTADTPITLQNVRIDTKVKVVRNNEGYHIFVSDGTYNSNTGKLSNGYRYGWNGWPSASYRQRITRVINDADTTLATTSNGFLQNNVEYILSVIYASPTLKMLNNDSLILSASDSTYSSRSYLALSCYSGGEYWIDWIRVRKYVEPEPTVTVTDRGSYYEVTITNNTSTDLTDFQVSFAAADVGVTSTSESLAISDSPPSPPYVWTKGWHLYRDITVTNNGAADVTDPVIVIELDANNFDFSRARSDGKDILITKDDDVTVLPYHIAVWDSASQRAVIVARLSGITIPAGQSATIRLWYNNPSATQTQEDPASVYDFWDDFDGTALDTNKWTVTNNGGSITVANSKVTIDTTSSTTATSVKITPNITLTSPVVAVASVSDVWRDTSADMSAKAYVFGATPDPFTTEVSQAFVASPLKNLVTNWDAGLFVYWEQNGTGQFREYFSLNSGDVFYGEDTNGIVTGFNAQSPYFYVYLLGGGTYGQAKYSLDWVGFAEVDLEVTYTVGAEGSAIFDHWSYRLPITVSNGNGTGLTDFQVKVVIDTQTPIGAGKMNSDGSDIRFTTSDGKLVIPHWVETGINSPTTTIWVKVPSIPANGTTTIYMNYGQSSATDMSNSEAVFDFFDDFEGTSLDTSKWDIVTNGGTYSVANSEVLLDPADNANNAVALVSKQTFTENIIIEEKLRTNTDTYWDVALSTTPTSATSWHWQEVTTHRGYALITQKLNDPGKFDLVKRNDTDAYQLCSSAWACGSYVGSYTVGADTFVQWIVKSTGEMVVTLSYYDGGTQIGHMSATDTEYTHVAKYLVLWQGEYSQGWGGESWVDWVRVRKYAPTEPITTNGAEEPIATATTYEIANSGAAYVVFRTVLDGSGLARILRSVQIARDGNARILRTIQQAINSVARVLKTSETQNTGNAYVLYGHVIENSGTARILMVKEDYRNAKARVLIQYTNGITGTARVVLRSIISNASKAVTIFVRQIQNAANAALILRKMLSNTGSARIIKTQEMQTTLSAMVHVIHYSQNSGTARVLIPKYTSNEGHAWIFMWQYGDIEGETKSTGAEGRNVAHFLKRKKVV